MTIFQPTIEMKKFIDENGVEFSDTFLDENGGISIINSVDSVAQTVSNSIALWKNEYQFDTTLGTPWQNILGEYLDKLLLNSYVENAVLRVLYVTSIQSIDYLTDNKKRKTNVIVRYLNEDNIQGTANAVV
jgi:hypothetical protein